MCQGHKHGMALVTVLLLLMLVSMATLLMLKTLSLAIQSSDIAQQSEIEQLTIENQLKHDLNAQLRIHKSNVLLAQQWLCQARCLGDERSPSLVKRCAIQLLTYQINAQAKSAMVVSSAPMQKLKRCRVAQFHRPKGDLLWLQP